MRVARAVRQATYTLSLTTTWQGLFDVTEQECAGRGTEHVRGLLVVWCSHTSASLLVQANADPEVQAGLEAFFTRLAPERHGLYRHEEEGWTTCPPT